MSDVPVIPVSVALRMVRGALGEAADKLERAARGGRRGAPPPNVAASRRENARRLEIARQELNQWLVDGARGEVEADVAGLLAAYGAGYSESKGLLVALLTDAGEVETARRLAACGKEDVIGACEAVLGARK